jgi:lactate dehydrogenase-like 2-hydroxyacid dehydrogenase
VVVLGALPALGHELLGERFVLETGGQVAGAAGIVTDPSIPVTADLLDEAGTSLVVVANYAVGYDNIDLDAARARGVRVTNTPDVLTNATAELAVGLMLAAARRIAEADSMVRGGRWAELVGREVAGATVGLVGFGRIARRVAELLGGFEVRLLATSRSSGAPSPGVERLELLDLLGESDFVSVHVPLAPETRHLIDANALAAMRPGAILVNTSRGAVVDTMALIDALRSGHLGAAGLDVYEDEPHVPPDLRELPNTVLLPHIGSATGTTRDAMARLCADNVIAVIDGRDPPTPLV